MKKIHYSRTGYNGDYTYTSVCGKKVATHQKNETSSIYPEDANCQDCLAELAYKADIEKEKTGIKIRIYLESDILQSGEFRNAQREVYRFAEQNGLNCVERIFSQVIDRAWHDLDKTWQAVKNADEIYSTSSLLPLCGDANMGAPVIFNGMCARAVKEKINGKSVIILNHLSSINWYYIDIGTMKKAFKKNSLYMYDDSGEGLIKIDVSQIKK
jgi:hypothetical protein